MSSLSAFNSSFSSGSSIEDMFLPSVSSLRRLSVYREFLEDLSDLLVTRLTSRIGKRIAFIRRSWPRRFASALFEEFLSLFQDLKAANREECNSDGDPGSTYYYCRESTKVVRTVVSDSALARHNVPRRICRRTNIMAFDSQNVSRIVSWTGGREVLESRYAVA